MCGRALAIAAAHNLTVRHSTSLPVIPYALHLHSTAARPQTARLQRQAAVRAAEALVADQGNRSSFPVNLPVAVLHAGFALTGLVQTLLGPILLALAPHLGLRDTQAGLLFTAQFAGSSLGAFLSRGKLARTMASGYALLGMSAALLSVAGARTALPLFFFLGLGLGLAMTSTSMLIGLHFFPLRRGAALSLLNFSWSVGALVCPLLVARLLAAWGLAAVFIFVAAAGFLTCFVSLLTVRSGATVEASRDALAAERGSPRRSRFRLVLFFVVLTFLYVGVEVTITGWMATYAHRVASLDLIHAAAVPSIFWAAFLIGRGATAGLLLRIRDELLFLAGLVAALVGLGILLMAHTAVVLAIGAIAIGLALAPLFPLSLALFFGRTDTPAHAAWVLGLCGFGASLLPWLSGVVSNQTGSLRVGLLVPALALIVMLGMYISTYPQRRRHPPQQAGEQPG